MHAYMHTCIHACIHAYMHTVHTYIHTYIHTISTKYINIISEMNLTILNVFFVGGEDFLNALIKPSHIYGTAAVHTETMSTLTESVID